MQVQALIAPLPQSCLSHNVCTGMCTFDIGLGSLLLLSSVLACLSMTFNQAAHPHKREYAALQKQQYSCFC